MINYKLKKTAIQKKKIQRGFLPVSAMQTHTVTVLTRSQVTLMKKRKIEKESKLRLELQTLSKILIPDHKYFHLLKKSPFSPIIFPTK